MPATNSIHSAMTLSNKRVCAFYSAHPNLNFETMNVVLVDMLENLLKIVDTSSVNDTIATQLLSSVRLIGNKLDTVQSQVSEFKDFFHKELETTMNHAKDEYVKQFNTIVSSNTTESIYPLIKQQTDIFLDKIKLGMINVENSHNAVPDKIKQAIQQACASINIDVKSMKDGVLDKKAIDDFLVSVNTKIHDAINASSTNINNNMTATESRIESKLSALQKSTIDTNTAQNELRTDVSSLIRKMEVSNIKGKMSESVVFNILHSLYPMAEIDYVAGQKETGDIIVQRNDKPKILIENKNYGKNVGQDEVRKFIRDVDTQDCCGLFLSQNYGISNKNNFEINVHNGNVIVYVHNANSDPEKIKIAIDIIDHFKTKLDEIREMNSDNTGFESIPKDVLDEINKEYQQFMIDRLTHVRTIKEMSQKLLKQTECFRFPMIDTYLSSRYAFSSSKFVCEYCGYNGKNQSAISAHQRTCKQKNKPGPDGTPSTSDNLSNASHENEIKQDTPIQPAPPPSRSSPNNITKYMSHDAK